MEQNQKPIVARRDGLSSRSERQTKYKPSSGASLKSYVRIVLARKWIVFFTCIAALSATFYSLRRTEPVYEAQVLMMRAESKGNPSLAFLNQYVQTPFSESIQGHKELLSCASSVVGIKEQLEREHNLEFTGGQIKGNFSLSSKENSPIVRLTATAHTPERAQVLANTVAEIYIRKINEIKRADLTQGVAFLQAQMTSVNEKLTGVEETLNELRANDKIVFIPQANSSSTRLSSGPLNKLQELEIELSKTEIDIEWIEIQLQSVRNSISEEEHVSSDSFPQSIEPIQSKLVEMQIQLDSMLENFTEEDPKVVSVQRQVDALKKRLDTELAKIRDNGHNSIYSLSELKSLMQQSVLLDARLKGLKLKEALLKQKIATFKKENPDLIKEQSELTSLQRQARVHEQTYMILLERHEEMSLLKQMEMSRLQIIDPAVLPTAPISPKKKVLLLLSFVLGLGLGVGIAFFLEYLDDSIKLKEDVEEYLALPVIGAIPKIEPFEVPAEMLNGSTGSKNILALESVKDNPDSNPSSRFLSTPIKAQHNGEESNAEVALGKRRKRKKGSQKQTKKLLSGILLFADKKSPVIPNYRTLAANIRYANVDAPIKTILITSPAPNEGKTSTSTNLAISLAQMGKRVLLLDADLRKRRIHRIFQQDSSPGLTDYLADENNSSQEQSNPFAHDNARNGEPFIRPTEVDNLYIFPSGSHVSSPEMLLGSEKMKQLVKSLREEYDIVLFDSPPLLSAADAMMLANEVDSTLMVIKSGTTKRQIAFQAKELLENVDADILGVVLNDIDYSKQYGSYYYYYYYYRSYYYSEDEEEE